MIKTSVSTQTETTTFLKALQDAFGSSIGADINSQLSATTLDHPLTIFAPDSDTPDPKWLMWAPPPLRGAYTRDIIQRVATHGLSVTDAVRGETHVVQPIDDENVFFKQCRVLLKTAINIFHSRGYVIGYRVCQNTSDRIIESSEVSQELVRENSSASSSSSGKSRSTMHAAARISRVHTQQARAKPPSIRKMESQLLRQHM